jgi:hypothetical protein
MINRNSPQLPIVVKETPGNGFRRFHLIIALLILILILIAQSSRDTFEGLVIIAAISIPCEFLRFWVRRKFGYRYEIDTEGVRYRSHSKTWTEPLSAYEGLDWHEDTERDSGRHWQVENRMDWRVVLCHGTNPERSIVIASSSLSKRNRVTDHKYWCDAVHALGLPGRQFKEGTPVTGELTVSDAQDADPKPSKNSDQILQKIEIDGTRLQLRRSLFAWVLPVLFTAALVYLVPVEILTGDWVHAVNKRGGLLLIALIGFGFLWFWTLSVFCLQVDEREVVIISSIGSWNYRTQRADLNKLSEVVSYDSPAGLGPSGLALNFEGQTAFKFACVKYHQANAIKRFLSSRISEENY